ncbi:MAG: nucleotide exchange factor GrpE [Bacteroidales bacterium]
MGEPISNTFASFNEEEPKENKDINPSGIETNESLNTENVEKTTVINEDNTTPVEKEEEKQFDTLQSLQKESIINPELTLIKAQISDLSAQFESKIKYDKHKEEIIDKLHSENQAFKNDLYKKLILPFVNEIIFMLDDYSILFKKHSETGINEVEVPKLLKQFGGISEDLENLLYKNGIDVYTVEGEQFDSSKQKVIKTIPTDDPLKDKTVCDKLKKGFVLDGKIIRMEHVSCYKFEKTNV